MAIEAKGEDLSDEIPKCWGGGGLGGFVLEYTRGCHLYNTGIHVFKMHDRDICIMPESQETCKE